MRRHLVRAVMAAAFAAGAGGAALGQTAQFDPRGSAWVLVEWSGTALLHASRPSLAFHPDGALSGRGTCNRFVGNYALKGPSIALETKHWSALACYPREAMEADTKFGKDLQRVTRLSLGSDGRLAAHDKDGAVIFRFRRAAPSAR